MHHRLTMLKGDTPRQIKPTFIFRLFVVLTWLLLLLPLESLLSYTSANPEVWNKYSIQYAGLLLFYFNFLLLWLLLLFLPGQYIYRISSWLRELTQYPQFYIQFGAVCISASLLVLMTINLWGWGQNRQLQLGIILAGGWLVALPMLWDWGLKGWQFKGIPIRYIYSWLTQNFYFWLRPLVAGGVLLLGAVLAFMTEEDYWLLVIGLFPVVGLVWVLWHWRPLGVIALVPASLIIPFEIKTGSEFSKPHAPILLLLLLLGMWVLDMILERKIKLPRSQTVLPLLVFSGVVVFAFGFGQLSWYPTARASTSAQVGATMIFILSFAAFLVVGYQIRELRWLEWMTWIFIVLGGVYVAARLWPALGNHLLPVTSWRWQDNIGRFQPKADGSLFWVWLVALSFSQAAFNRRLHVGWRLAVGGVALATLYFGLFVNRVWVSGYAPPLVAVVVALLSAAPRLTIPMTLLGSVGVAVKMQELVSKVAMVGDNEYSLLTRQEAWLIVLELTKVNPILGLGPANYYYYTPLIPIRGYFVKFNSHSQYIDLIAQTGLLGLACFFWFAGVVGWVGWQLRTRVPDGFARAYVHGALGGLAGTLVAAALGDWVLPFTYNVGLSGVRASILGWIFLGGLLALEQMFRPTDEPVKTGKV